MSTQFCHYNDPEDYWRVDEFLIENHQPGNQDGNWVEPAWEYMHYHPLLDSTSLGKIGIWEDARKIVAVAHYEWRLGEAFFQFHPDYRHLRQEMLEYAESNLYGRSRQDGRKELRVFVNDNDRQLQALVQARDYQKRAAWNRPMAEYDIPAPYPSITLPGGFSLKSLADECDWAKVHRVLWRGFEHEGEPPADEADPLPQHGYGRVFAPTTSPPFSRPQPLPQPVPHIAVQVLQFPPLPV